nr:hypothetical protein Q903MT_gene4620 [Picea sitchensis]
MNPGKMVLSHGQPYLFLRLSPLLLLILLDINL